MKIALLGATGAVGQEVVRQAIERGHEVTALVRDSQKLGNRGDRLDVVVGDLTDAEAINRVVEGADAVLSAVGPGPKSDPAVFEAGMKNVVAAMNKHDVQRIIVISGFTQLVPGDVPSLRRRIMTGLIKMLGKAIYESKDREFAVLSASGLQWTALRPTMTKFDDKPSGKVAVDELVAPGLKMAASDMAMFMLDQIGSTEWVHKAPFVATQR